MKWFDKYSKVVTQVEKRKRAEQAKVRKAAEKMLSDAGMLLDEHGNKRSVECADVAQKQGAVDESRTM